MRTKLLIICLIVALLIALLSSCGTAPSSGIVQSKLQTFTKYGRPDFYVYILDDQDNHIYEKEVDPNFYFKVKEGKTRLTYDKDLGIYNIKVKK